VVVTSKISGRSDRHTDWPSPALTLLTRLLPHLRPWQCPAARPRQGAAPPADGGGTPAPVHVSSAAALTGCYAAVRRPWRAWC